MIRIFRMLRAHPCIKTSFITTTALILGLLLGNALVSDIHIKRTYTITYLVPPSLDFPSLAAHVEKVTIGFLRHSVLSQGLKLKRLTAP